MNCNRCGQKLGKAIEGWLTCKKCGLSRFIPGKKAKTKEEKKKK